MYTFYLFRIKKETTDLFRESEQRSGNLIHEAINEKPCREVNKKQTWRLGNIENIDENSIIFSFGKVQKAKKDTYDEEKGDFTEAEITEAPYVYVVIDFDNQVCAIEHKATVGSDVKKIGKYLSTVLSNTEACNKQAVNIQIDPISNPDDLISLIKKAETISMFKMGFGLPNPFDVEGDFHKPMEKLLASADAKTGNTQIKGSALNKSIVKELVRSASSTGYDARVKLRLSGDKKSTIKETGDQQ